MMNFLLRRVRATLIILSETLGSLVSAGERPNIVFAFADDLGRYASIYADPRRPSPNDVIHTPAIDQLAREGTLFACALVSAPSCTPSRAAVLSGRHFFRNGRHAQLHHPWINGVADPWDEVQGFPLALQAAGYHIGWTYKMHIKESLMGGPSHNYKLAGEKFNSFGRQMFHAKNPAAKRLKLLAEVRQNFRDFLVDAQPGQPYFYWFNPTNTHRPFARGSGRQVWGLDPDQLVGKLPKFLPDNPIIREDFADYLGEAQAFDAAVQVLRDELEERGELDNTLLVVSGDHGAPGFPRGKCNLYDFGVQVPLVMHWPSRVAAGRRIASPVSLVDLAPTFLDAVDLKNVDDVDGQSLLPAMHIGTEEPEAELRGIAFTGRENHVREARPGGLPYPMRAIRTREYLYIINFAPERWPVAQPPLSAAVIKGMVQENGRWVRQTDVDRGPTRTFFEEHENDPHLADAWRLGFGLRPAEELYAVAIDPDQIHNLADSDEHQSTKAKLRKQLFAELTRRKDRRVTDADSAFDHPPYAPVDKTSGVIQLRTN